mgnify:FL=1
MPTSTSSWRTDAHRPLPTVILFAGGAAKAASAPPRPAPPTGRRGFAKASMGSTPPARCSPGAAEGTARAPPAPCWPGLLLLHSRTATATHSRCPRAGQSTHHARSELFGKAVQRLLRYKRLSTVPTVLPQYQIGGGPIHSRCDCCWYLAHSDATISSETCHASGRRFLRPRGPCGFNTPKCCLGLTHLLAPQQFLPRVALDGRGPYSVRRPGARGRSGPPTRADRWHEVSVGNFAKETGFAPQGVYLAVAGTAANADGGSVSSRPSCRTCPRRSGAVPT